MPRSSASSPDRLRSEQLTRLRAGLRGVLRGNRFQRARLADVRGWDDFERLPFTTKAELVADQAAEPPYGTNLTLPIDAYTRLHQTSGSSGTAPLRWLDTPESWEWWTAIWAGHVLPAAGIGPRDRVLLAFSFGPFIGFWSAFAGAERLGALVIPAGGMTTGQRVRAVMDLGVTAVLCTPTYALRMAEAAAETGVDLAASPVRATVHAGEPGAGIPGTRDRIEAAFGARAHDHSGMTELGPTGFSCAARSGLHLVESEFIVEVLGESGGVANEGEGELVATNLGRWGMPVVRYRTGDRVRLTRAPCPCGSPFARLEGGILGRVDDMLTVRGVNFFPAQVEDVVAADPAAGEHRLEVRRERGMDEVTLVVETAAPPGELAGRLEAALREAMSLRVEVREVPPGSVPRGELKSRRLVRL